MWCHCRAVYLPMSYVYGKRFVGRITPLVLELRNELYGDPYNLIDWNKARNQCAKVCLFVCLRRLLNYLASTKKYIFIQFVQLFWTTRRGHKNFFIFIFNDWS